MRNRFEKLQLRVLRYRRIHWPRKVRLWKRRGRHPYAVPIITFGVLIILTATLYGVARGTHHLTPPPDAKIVIISHDGLQQTVPSKEPTVGALLKKLNLNLAPGDAVEPAATTPIEQDDFRINIYRGFPVEVVENGQKTLGYSAGKTPRAVANQIGFRVYPEDTVTSTPNQNFLADSAIGQQIVIDPATPINLNLYGTQFIVRTHVKTVGELIKEKNIKLAASDQVMPAASTPLAAGTQVYIERQGTKIEAITKTIPMPIQSINDPGLAFGTNAIRQQGSAGQEVITYQDQTINGVVVGRTPIQTVITQQPVTEIVVIGTSLSGIKGDMALAGIAPGDYNYADYIISHESGWCPTKAQGQYGGCPPYAGYVPSYGGYGLCQATPGGKMASAGSDWATNPITQLRWCSGYAHSRYGSWYAAYEHWLANHNW